jgi:hypothetical protein
MVTFSLAAPTVMLARTVLTPASWAPLEQLREASAVGILQTVEALVQSQHPPIINMNLDES